MSFLKKIQNIIPTGNKNAEEEEEFDTDDIEFEDDAAVEVDGSDALNPETMLKLAGGNKGSTDDILKVLRIPKSFEIKSEVLFPGDLDGLEFPQQVPKGYDMSEVDFFVNKVNHTIQEYVRLLQQRNEDIQKLANEILKIRAELTNMRVTAELGNGISIMTGDAEDTAFLESQLSEERLRNARLQEKLDKLEESGVVGGEDTDLVADLRRRLEAETWEKENAKSNADSYWERLVMIEDQYGISAFPDAENSDEFKNNVNVADENFVKPGTDPFVSREREAALHDDGGLPTLDEGLPDIDDDEELPSEGEKSDRERYNNSAFTQDEYMDTKSFVDEVVEDEDEEGGFDFQFKTRGV